MVTKVVIPARTSVLTFVPFSDRLKNLSKKLSDPLEIEISFFNGKTPFFNIISEFFYDHSPLKNKKIPTAGNGYTPL
jgi:hypothetical protein